MVSELGTTQHRFGKERLVVFIISSGQARPNIRPQLRLYNAWKLQSSCWISV
jgi:hypothetical protein